ncbi:hypothetical protein AB0J21_27050 [Streptomyces sp. NPDC049954]|uniref:hypothetical protein n=1 Tax=Streptomyces sp. NPDC049954 TaxID=3155779 RepID=UPI003447B810
MTNSQHGRAAAQRRLVAPFPRNRKGAAADTRAASAVAAAAAPASAPMTPERQNLRDAFQHLQALTGLRTAAEVISALRKRGYPVVKSAYSRYLSGRRTPDAGFAAALYGLAVERSGADRVGVSLEEVQAMREETLMKRCCASCRNTATENAALAAENEALRMEAELLRGRLEQAGLASVPRPGEELAVTASTTARATSTKLPVGQDSGDRQAAAAPDEGNEDGGAAPESHLALPAVPQPAAEQLVRRITELSGHHAGGSQDGEAALALLLETTQSLTPAEMGATVRLLQESGLDGLADSLLTAYARRRRASDVIHAALTLHEAAATASLRTLLMTAARRSS